ncbi:MAG TPA: extracellular solute-binding protein [Pirellula sp.]|nr:extracellular solute-binding protein [Pirellula sp.]
MRCIDYAGLAGPQVKYRFWLSVILACSSAFDIGCVPRREESVVLYSAADREYVTPILDAFERANTGTEIARQFDVEASKTLGLVTRIEREKERPKCDVFWNNELIHTIRLQKQGLLASRRWKVPDSWPKGFKAKDGTWIGFAARARVLLINKYKLPDPANWPKSVLELAEKKWHQRCGLAYPVYGTTATHMAVLASHAATMQGDAHVKSDYFKRDRSLDWLVWSDGWIEHSVVLSGNKQVALAVSSGELEWGLTDTDDAIIEKESGQPVEIVFPDQGESDFGTVFIPNTISVLQKAPNPTAAALLADFLVSEKSESRLTMGNSAQFPVWPEAKIKSRLSGSKEPRWANVDFEVAAEGWAKTMESLKQRLELSLGH